VNGTGTKLAPWREEMYVVIFEHHTRAGKLFDVALLAMILASVVAVMLESVAEIRVAYGPLLRVLEWGFTLLFTAEYICRLIAVRRPVRYALSFFGVVDVLAIIPTYLSFFVLGAQSLIVIRALRLLRVFRILKLGEYTGEAAFLMNALRASREKITVFLMTVLTVILIVGSMMYLIEGEANGFTSIPKSVYWAIVTMTTVPGQLLASALMILGYGVIAVPTGIVTVELNRAGRGKGRRCEGCSKQGHDADAAFCKYCGAPL
jgi:voltage-gated potassium channel